MGKGLKEAEKGGDKAAKAAKKIPRAAKKANKKFRHVMEEAEKFNKANGANIDKWKAARKGEAKSVTQTIQKTNRENADDAKKNVAPAMKDFGQRSQKRWA